MVDLVGSVASEFLFVIIALQSLHFCCTTALAISTIVHFVPQIPQIRLNKKLYPGYTTVLYFDNKLVYTSVRAPSLVTKPV